MMATWPYYITVSYAYLTLFLARLLMKYNPVHIKPWRLWHRPISQLKDIQQNDRAIKFVVNVGKTYFEQFWTIIFSTLLPEVDVKKYFYLQSSKNFDVPSGECVSAGCDWALGLFRPRVLFWQWHPISGITASTEVTSRASYGTLWKRTTTSQKTGRRTPIRQSTSTIPPGLIFTIHTRTWINWERYGVLRQTNRQGSVCESVQRNGFITCSCSCSRRFQNDCEISNAGTETGI